MKQTPLENRIAEIAAPAAKDLGLDVVCVRIIGEGGGRNVQVIAENIETGNLGLDDCAELSRALSALLDVEDPISGPYRLEVSSPGIDRFLARPQDFERFAGFEAKIETALPNENGQRRFRGRLGGLEGETVRLTTETGDERIPLDAIIKARLVLTDELIKATAKKAAALQDNNQDNQIFEED